MSIKALSALLALAAAPLTAAQVFVVNCDPLTIQRSDPIVSPGGMSSHVHVVTGGTGFQQTQSNAVAVASKATTCDKTLDHSNYWQPQMYYQNPNGTFSIVNMAGNAAYYLNRACDYQEGRKYCDGAPMPKAPPAGLRMLVGDPTRRTYNDSIFEHRAIRHMCLKADSSEEYIAFPPEPCERIRAETFFPSCWDGKNLDSADHKSHMAFPALGDYNGGVCPPTHPVAIFSIFYEFFYDTGVFADHTRLVYAMADKTGYGLHGDFLNGWQDQDRLQRAMTTCTGPNGVNDKGCSLVVNGSPGSPSRQTPEVKAPAEEVGLNGPLATLPGNNPVVSRREVEFAA